MNMKTYKLSDDRLAVVKKQQGQLTVTIKQTDSTEKFIEFTARRYAVFFVVGCCIFISGTIATHMLLLVLLVVTIFFKSYGSIVSNCIWMKFCTALL